MGLVRATPGRSSTTFKASPCAPGMRWISAVGITVCESSCFSRSPVTVASYGLS